ncbi:hypothetical protein AB6A40_006150 [Gnathostoma spinigerum]|uniref:COMM domain-containing protein n=1 Tax=Gnathostoma spinigerum TaxID=75299 RepID=A0ABD6EJL8_9BILA
MSRMESKWKEMEKTVAILPRQIVEDAWKAVVGRRSLETDVSGLSKEQLMALSRFLEFAENLQRSDDLHQSFISIPFAAEHGRKVSKVKWKVEVPEDGLWFEKSLKAKVVFTIKEHTIQMSLDQLAKLRYEVSRSMKEMQKYL